MRESLIRVADVATGLPFPEVRILAGDPPQCFVRGHLVEPRGEKVQLGEHTMFVLDLVMLWAKKWGRAARCRDRRGDEPTSAHHLDLMR